MLLEWMIYLIMVVFTLLLRQYRI